MKRRSINSVIPSLLTLTSCCAGLTAVRFALENEVINALTFILAAAVLDGLDGTVARWLKATSQFGGELDSLADFVAFGVSPGLIVYYITTQDLSSWGWMTSLFFILCCGLRLARFNVANLIPSDTETKKEPFFRGIPAPGGGLLLLAPLALVQIQPQLAQGAAWPVTMACWQVTLGLLMVSNIPTFSPKTIRFPVNKRLWLILILLCVIILTINQPWLMWFVIGAIYFLSIPLVSLKLKNLPSSQK